MNTKNQLELKDIEQKFFEVFAEATRKTENYTSAVSLGIELVDD